MVCTDAADLEVIGVLRARQARRIRATGVFVERVGGIHGERFVWALGVVDRSEAVELALLKAEVGSGRTRGFGFQRAVHPLMTTILLRAGELGEFGVNSEFDPPNRESGKPCQTRAREGCAVVGADRRRQPVLPKESLEFLLGSVVFD